jgi:hypothetical protein
MTSAHAYPLGGFIQHIRETRRDVQLIIGNGRRKRLEGAGADHRIPGFFIQDLEALAAATRDKDDLVRQVAAEAKAAIERAP